MRPPAAAGRIGFRGGPGRGDRLARRRRGAAAGRARVRRQEGRDGAGPWGGRDPSPSPPLTPPRAGVRLRSRPSARTVINSPGRLHGALVDLQIRPRRRLLERWAGEGPRYQIVLGSRPRISTLAVKSAAAGRHTGSGRRAGWRRRAGTRDLLASSPRGAGPPARNVHLCCGHQLGARSPHRLRLRWPGEFERDKLGAHVSERRFVCRHDPFRLRDISPVCPSSWRCRRCTWPYRLRRPGIAYPSSIGLTGVSPRFRELCAPSGSTSIDGGAGNVIMSGPWIAVVLLLAGITLIQTTVMVGLIRRASSVLERTEEVLSRRSTVLGPAVGLPRGTSLPDFQAFTVNGATVRAADLSGKSNLFLILSESCEPCRALAASLAKPQERLDLGVRLIVVVDRFGEYLQGLHSLADVVLLRQENREVSRAFDSDVSPHAILVDSHGTILDNAIPGSNADLRELASQVAPHWLSLESKEIVASSRSNGGDPIH